MGSGAMGNRRQGFLRRLEVGWRWNERRDHRWQLVQPIVRPPLFPHAYGDECKAADPACEPPQKIIGGDQDREDSEGSDDTGGLRSLRQRIDEKFHAVLCRYRAAHGADDGDENRKMRDAAPSQVAANEGERPVGVFAQLVHQSKTVHQFF